MVALGLLCYWRAFSSCHQQRLLSSYSAGASHCSGLSCCRYRALGAWVSGVVAQGLSYSMAYGIFPEQRWNSCLLYWQVDSLPLRHRGSPVCLFLIKCFNLWMRSSGPWPHSGAWLHRPWCLAPRASRALRFLKALLRPLCMLTAP